MGQLQCTIGSQIHVGVLHEGITLVDFERQEAGGGAGRLILVAAVTKAAQAVVIGALAIGSLGFQSWPEPHRPIEPHRKRYCAPAVEHGPDRAPVSKTDKATGCWCDTGFENQSPSIQMTRNGTLQRPG